MAEKWIDVNQRARLAGSYDAVVAGGGPAGWVAAVSAARAGLKTALVERYGFLGGAATGGLVIPISGFFFKGRRVIGGIPWEFIERLKALGAAKAELPKGHISFHPEYYKLAAQRMALESGVELFTNSCLSGLLSEQGEITHIIIAGKNGPEALAGRCFIDATGDADLFRMAGLPMLEQQGPFQPASLCFLLEGADASTDLLKDCIHHDGAGGRPSCNAVIRSYLLERLQSGNLPQFGGPWFNTLLKGGSLAVNVTRASADAADRAGFTRAECRLREDMFAITSALKEGFPEFAGAEIAVSAANAGVRETRRIKGKYTLTARDFTEGRAFECPVAHCAHPMDIHSAGGAGQRLLPLETDCYIPHTAMVAEGAPNLIAAGRCISAEREPYASIRVQGTMMSVGEAAGVMAGLYCSAGGHIAELPAAALKGLLDKRGLVL